MAIIDIKRTVSLDGAIMPVALEGTLYGGENQAHRFIINTTKDGAALNLTGSVTASFLRKADDAEVPLTGEIIGGGAAVTLVQSCYTKPGRFELTIFLTQNGSKTALYSCNGNVRNTSASEIVDPGHVVPDVSDIVAEYERMQAASDAAEAAAENANEAAQFATDDEWTNGDTLQTGRVYQTLHMANFEEETAGQYLRVISGNVAQAQRVNQSGWSVYRYGLPHRMLIRLEAIEKNTPTVQGVLPMAAVLTSGSTETLYSLDSDRTGTYILADALLVNYNTTLNASAIKNVSFTAVANRQFEDVIVCLDHAAEFDKIVVFGDSIFANYINSTTVGNGVMAQFASLMGLPVVNNAVGGATLSTMQSSPKNVVQQVQDYIASATPGGTPLYMIDGGTNDQYNNGAGLANLGQYTDGVNGITNTIYGATYRIINDLLGFGAQPWQIVICTPIPKGIRGDAAYVATMDAQLTAIAGAMAEIAMVQQCNVINGYGAPFDNLTTDTAKAIIMPDDTHPSVYGAKLYAERIFRLLGVANQREVTELKSHLKKADEAIVFGTDTFIPLSWSAGSIDTSTGEYSESGNRQVSDFCAIEQDSFTVSYSSPVSNCMVFWYDENKTYRTRTSWTASGTTLPKANAYFRIMARKDGTAPLTSEDIKAFKAETSPIWKTEIAQTNANVEELSQKLDEDIGNLEREVDTFWLRVYEKSNAYDAIPGGASTILSSDDFDVPIPAGTKIRIEVTEGFGTVINGFSYYANGQASTIQTVSTQTTELRLTESCPRLGIRINPAQFISTGTVAVRMTRYNSVIDALEQPVMYENAEAAAGEKRLGLLSVGENSVVGLKALTTPYLPSALEQNYKTTAPSPKFPFIENVTLHRLYDDAATPNKLYICSHSDKHIFYSICPTDTKHIDFASESEYAANYFYYADISNPSDITKVLLPESVGGVSMVHRIKYVFEMSNGDVLVEVENGGYINVTHVDRHNNIYRMQNVFDSPVVFDGSVCRKISESNITLSLSLDYRNERLSAFDQIQEYKAGHIVCAPYGGRASAKVYVTSDYGSTWDLIFCGDSTNATHSIKPKADHLGAADSYGVWPTPEYLNGDPVDWTATANNNIHIHGVAYDRWYDRIWICTGDGGNLQNNVSGIWWTDDLGYTWSRIGGTDKIGTQLMGVIPMEHNVLFATDGYGDGFWRWARNGKDKIITIENCYNYLGTQSNLVMEAGRSIVSKNGFVLTSFAPDNADQGDWVNPGGIVATYNGFDFEKIYTDTYSEGTFETAEIGWSCDITDCGDKLILKADKGGYIQLDYAVEKQRYTKPLSGKRVVFMGDSIIGNFYDGTGICHYFEEITGAAVMNCAFGGTKMSYSYTSNPDNVAEYERWSTISGAGLADAIASGDFSAQQAAIAAMTQWHPTYFADRIQEMASVDWSKVDYLCWNYGTNDIAGGSMLSDANDPSNMYAYDNAYRHAVETILTAYPNIRIIGFTPIYRWFIDASTGEFSYDSTTYNKRDYGGTYHTFADFVEMAKTVCKEYLCPCVDAYYTTGINRYTYLKFFSSNDGTHPNEEGRSKIGPHMARQFLAVC